MREGMEKRRDDRDRENFYHAYLYEFLQDHAHQAMRAAKVNISKTKLVKLYSTRFTVWDDRHTNSNIFQEE